ncbi:MAG: S1 RNA-binding domain-containing protein [bacterium]|nr:S1 RNA-binding domain-containing protein [bacterium]
MSKTVTMDDLLGSSEIKQLKAGDVVEGIVSSVRKHEVWIDLGASGSGMVVRRELSQGQNVEPGQTLTVSVVDPELDEGYALLSMRRAAKDKGLDELIRVREAGETIEIQAYDANRGGLLIELEGIRGFLPVSQLSADHYPRVSGADKDEIMQKLGALVKIPLHVRVLDVSKKENKLIFSEKEALKDRMQARFESLKVGDEVEGVITGVIDFGAFVNVDGIEGLIHISEISWERVEDPRKYVKNGEKIKAKIIAIDKERLSLSLKQMQEDPWLGEVKKFKKGDIVEGRVTRITPFGAFVQLSPSVEALVHVSEMGGGEGTDPEKVFNVNETKQFKLIDIDEDARKIALSLKESDAKPKKAAKEKAAKAEA